MFIPSAGSKLVKRVLRLLPPPRRMAPLLRALPQRWQHALIQKAMSHVLASALGDGSVDFMLDRRLAIEVDDLGLRWVIELHDEHCLFRAAKPTPASAVAPRTCFCWPGVSKTPTPCSFSAACA
ncbi:MAG: hypothetical protein M3Y93_01395 [Pseudomonadota bacterium]|nr:hypothetical protein [Pseudomonadota bacterium]